MTVMIDSTTMSSSRTQHRAHLVSEDRWTVTWLPDRVLTKHQAETAMRVAERIAAALPNLNSLAPSLGLTIREALGLATTEPTWPTSGSATAAYSHGRRWGR